MKLPFSPNPKSSFYEELLHLIGLTEINLDGRNWVERNPPEKRQSGAFLEEIIAQLELIDQDSWLDLPGDHEGKKEELIFNLAIELSVIWINRILFLKFLEAQLIRYHKGDQSYSFMSLHKIKSYESLHTLFFEVLARKYEERKLDVKFLFEDVPYLNSSLFEPTPLERQILMINQLNNNQLIPIISFTALRDQQGEKRTGKLPTLEYLLDFLNAYHFSQEGSAQIPGEDKSIISVLEIGEVLERVNGRKDEASFIPLDNSMSLNREALRKTVLDKFNAGNNRNCKNFDELSGLIEGSTAASKIIESIKIFDPAVGQGRFLLSALNEVIILKNDLGLLHDRHGGKLMGYQFEIVNEELIVRDRGDLLFQYQPSNKESQRMQEGLFHQKQTIIKNNLFGLGSDLKEVNLCRLRLWLALLNSIYYKALENDEGNASPVCYAGSPDLRPEFLPRRELQILPDLNLNIQCSSDQVFQFASDADLIRSSKEP